MPAERAICEHCLDVWNADELAPDHNGDRTCPDCRATFAGQDDTAEYSAYAYH